MAMDTWKTSTLLVIGAFVLSVLFLTFVGGSRERNTVRAPGPVDSEIYSPAAADPELRSPELASRVRASAKPRPRQTAQKVTVPKPAPKVIKPKVEATKPAAPAAKRNENVPAGHHYIVIVGTYSNPKKAERALETFKKKGAGKPFVGVFNEGQRFSVVAQTFKEERSARTFVKQLRDDHNWTEAFINFIGD